MNKFTKTMIVLMVACVSVFAQEINLNVQAQANPQITITVNPQERYERFSRMRRVGNGLIIGGAVVGTAGVAAGTVNLTRADDLVLFTMGGYNHFANNADRDAYDSYIIRAGVWTLVGTLGYSALTAGIPLRIVGRIRANHYRNLIPNSAYIIPNGARFSWKF